MNASRPATRSQAGWDVSSPWLFFALVFGATWVFLVPIALSGRPFTDPLVFTLAALGMVGPIAVDLLLVRRTRGRPGLRDFWVRLVDARRIPLRWLAVILLTQPLLAGLALLTHLALGGSMPPLAMPARLLADPWALLLFAAYVLVFGPLPEELGWRGYVLDRLQERYSALASSLILGLFWGLWHLPLFFIPGTYQHDEVGSLLFWIAFCLGTITDSVLMTWIYNNTRRSTLSAVLYHFMINFTGEFLDFPVAVKNFGLIWASLLVAVVVVRWGPQRLARSRDVRVHPLSR